MAKYLIKAEIRSVKGYHQYEVEADSPEEALVKYNKSDCRFLCEDFDRVEYREVGLGSVTLFDPCPF